MVLQPGHALRVILLELRESRRGLGFSRFALRARFLDTDGRGVSFVGGVVGVGGGGEGGELPFVGEDACGED